MGKLNSSLTRVQPIFGQLWAGDPTGKSWLEKLMTLGGHRPIGHPGQLVEPPRFEFPAPPPRDFLRWLVLNPAEWKMPSYETADDTRTKREALKRGDPETVGEAIAAIETSPTHERQWWCLEGTTRVDCALLTESAVIFIEGKRTEAGPSSSISWYGKRVQVLRNLDCARWYAMRLGLDYYAMLIIEGDDPKKAEIAEKTGSVAAFEGSFPHLSPHARELIKKRYLGVATWKQLSEAFGLLS